MLRPVHYPMSLSLRLTACFLMTLALRAQTRDQAVAQPGAPSELASHLQRLGQQASDLNSLMPGFTCNETFVSEERRGDKVKERTEFTSTLRTKRDADGKLNETFTIVTVGGKPYTPGKHVRMPIYISGGFDKAMSYFSPKRQACFHYTLSASRIEFETLPNTTEDLKCDPGMQGFAVLDAEGNVTHLERRVAGALKKERNVVSFAAIDFAPVELNGHTYRLSRRLIAEEPQGSSLGHFEAEYASCRLFTASVTLGAFNSTEPTADPQPAPASSTPR